LGALQAQTATPGPAASALPNIPDEQVIAAFEDGVKFTMGDLKKLYPALPPPLQNAAVSDPAEFFHEYAVMRKFTRLAEQEKLDVLSPYKEALVLNRMLILYQAKLDDAYRTASVEPADIVNYYDAHKESYKQVRVKAIYIAFADNPAAGRKELTEDQAKTKATRLVADLRGGTDFVKLVRENSDDETSKAKDGDFATLRPTDNVPDAIREAVFALKAGDISATVRQPHGFYIFRAEEVVYRPLSQVRDQIFSEIKTLHAKDWVTKADRETKVEFPNPAFQPKPGQPIGK
jgi:hypothetical protein